MSKNWLLIERAFLFILVLPIFLTGCGGPNSDNVSVDDELNAVSNTPINVLVVDDPAIAESAKRRWFAEDLGDANFTEMTMVDFAGSGFDLGDADVVVYSPLAMPELIAKESLLPIPKKYLDGENAGRKELLEYQRLILQRFGSDVYSMPLGSPQLVLVYNVKDFADLQIEPPKTWGDFETAIGKLRAEGKKVDIPFGDGWAADILLRRVASSIRAQGKIDSVVSFDKFEPKVETEPFVAALAALKKSYRPKQEKISPAQVYQRLLSGESSMGLTWPSYHFEGEIEQANEDLEIVQIPGSISWFDESTSKWQPRFKDDPIQVDVVGGNGRIVSVNSETSQVKKACEFAAWLNSKSISLSVSIESPNTSMYRASHLGQPSRWTGELISPVAADQFSDIVSRISNSKILLVFPRVPGQTEYMRILDQGVEKVIGEGVGISESLKEVSAEWEKVTEKYGRENQLNMLKRSEGFGD